MPRGCIYLESGSTQRMVISVEDAMVIYRGCLYVEGCIF